MEEVKKCIEVKAQCRTSWLPEGVDSLDENSHSDLLSELEGSLVSSGVDSCVITPSEEDTLGRINTEVNVSAQSQEEEEET